MPEASTLYSDLRITYNWFLAAGAAVTLALCIYNSVFPEAAIAVFGGYLIFWSALHVKSSFLASINNQNDISYGVYLYAWPLQCYASLLPGCTLPVGADGNDHTARVRGIRLYKLALR